VERILEEFKRKYWRKIRKKPNVSGYSGILHPRIKDGKEISGTKCIRIYVERKVPLCSLSPKERIPRQLELSGSSIETDIVVLPKIRFMDGVVRTTPEDHQKRYRPAPAGVSCIHKDGTACTLSWFFKKDCKVYVALNNHCGSLENTAKIEDEWLQPSPDDGGEFPRDIIAKLAFYIPTKYNGYKCPYRNFAYKIYKGLYYLTHFKPYEAINYVDISFGEPTNLEDLSFTIYGIEGKVVGKGEHRKGLKVYKSGRTTAVTEGTIDDPSWNGYVYGRRGTAWYEDCVLVKGKCAGGDSGSPIVSIAHNGLLYHGALFAGSDQGVFIYCKVENIEKIAGVELVTT